MADLAKVGGFFKTLGRTAFPFITLAAQAGGPLTAMAAQQVGKALGLDKPLEGADQIEAAMSKAALDPATRLAMQKAEEDFQLQVTTLTNGRIKDAQDFEAHLAQISADDRASARAREIAVKDNTPRNLAYIYAIGFFLTLAAIIGMAIAKVEVPASIDTSLSMLLGLEVGMVLGSKEYYFGSSAGSAKKDSTIEHLSE